jgi:taspase (threonine aspartase 1)
MNSLKDGKSALDAVEIAVKILEDNPLTNSGTGSSLTKCGFVECDAGIIDGKTGIFGCVGAVPGNKFNKKFTSLT